MRKFTLLFVSVLVTLSMLLSACGTPAVPSSDSAPTPATNTPGATSAPGAATTEVPPASYPNPEASYPNAEPHEGTIGVPGVFALFHILTAWVEIK